MIKNDFEIQIDDNSEVLPDEVIEQNSSFLDLHDWQKRGITYFFTHGCNVIFEAATGTGKTFFAIELLKKILEIDPDIQILIVVPKNVILETGWYSELFEGGFNLPDIGVFYGAIKEYAKITITNLHNLNRIPLELFDCIIFDELHNFGTPRLLEFVELEKKYKIGLSATVSRSDNNHLKLLKIFNYNVFKYSPKEALQDGILNPFYFFNIGLTMDQISFDRYTKLTQEINLILQMGGSYGAIMKKNSPLKLKLLSKMNERKELVNNYPLKFEIVKKICQENKDEKILVFSQYNKMTNKFYWALLDVGIKSKVIHSGIPQKERDQILIDFRLNRFNVLLTSKVLDEGYNLPQISCAIITAGDSSARQTIQRMGRVLRKKNKPSKLYQIFCKNTIEEVYGEARAKIFKELALEYEDMNY